MIRPYAVFKEEGKIIVGVKHYRHHLCISPQPPNGNAIAQTS
ncbi:hypothetical protein [Pseudanabaena sp. CCNP1317]|nr:hypothetical protein [Pseudanabaena sp. CCNP1317]MEA5487170.1 hypothetical protein [Pseudanabaena sp. CCNP1317]